LSSAWSHDGQQIILSRQVDETWTLSRNGEVIKRGKPGDLDYARKEYARLTNRA